MRNLLNFMKGSKNKNELDKTIKKQLRDKIEALKSLKEYDEGKKEISTSKVEGRMSNLRTPTRT